MNDDLISRQAAINIVNKYDKSHMVLKGKPMLGAASIVIELEDLPAAQTDLSSYSDKLWRAAYERGKAEAQQWIPCSERLPEEDKEVLISYRYKEGEGDTSHTYIDITTYGQMYFGGNKVGNYKHWRAPFEYFESNYEVVAWMLLPEPYKEADDE